MTHQTPSTVFPNGGASSLTLATDAGTIHIMGSASILGAASVATSASASTFYVSGPNSRLIVVADEGTASAINGLLNIQSPFPAVLNTTASMGTTLLNIHLIPVNFGGTGRNSLTQDHLLYGGGAGPVGLIPPGTDGQALISAQSGPPSFATITSSGGTLSFVAGPNSLDIRVDPSVFSPTLSLPVDQGGLGRTVLTAFGVLLGTGSLPVNVTNPGTNGQTLIAAAGADPTFSTITSFANTITFVAGYNALNMDVNLANIALLNPLQIAYGGTGQTSLTAYGVLIGEGSLGVHVTDPGINGQVLLASSTGDPKFAFITSFLGSLSFTYGYNSLNIDLSNVNLQVTFVPIEEGSTGRTALTSFGVLIGEGSLPVHVTDPGTNGQLLLAASGADPKFSTLTSSGNTVLFRPGYNSLDLNVNVSAVTPFAPLPVNFGGTGRTILTSFSVLVGEGSLPIHGVGPGINGQALISSSTGDPMFRFITSSGGTLSFTFGYNSLNIELNISNNIFLNPLPLSNGGTGSTLLTLFGVLVGAGSLSIAATDPGTDGQLLIASSTGAPSFATLSSLAGTVVFTPGPNSLNLDFSAPIDLKVQANSGSADFSGGLLDIFGDDPVQTFGTGSTLFIFLDTTSSFFNPLAPANGGTGQTILTTYGVLIGEGNSSIGATPAGTNGEVLIASSIGDPLFSELTSIGNSITFSGGYNALNLEATLEDSFFVNPLPVANGGTGQTLLSAYGVLIGKGQNPIDVTNPGQSGQILLAASGSDPAFSYLTTGGTLSFTVGYNSLNIDVNLGLDLFNPVPVANGGTGLTILTSFGVLIGKGDDPIDATTAGLNGQVLIAASSLAFAFATITSLGETLTFQVGYNSLNIEVNQAGVTFSTFQVLNGGTSQTVLTPFGVLVGSGQNPIDATSAGQNGEVLIASSIGDPAFAAISSTGSSLTFKLGYNTLNIDLDLASTPLFNPLPVSNGGTGNTTLSPYAVLCGGITNIGALQSISSLGSAGQILTSNGVGSLPSFQDLGGAIFEIINVITFTSLSPTVYIPSAGAKYSVIECVGGGGGGGGASASSIGVGAGGGAGGYIKIITASVSIGTPLVTVGTGGAGGIGANPGAQGGTSSVGIFMSGFGGYGGGTDNQGVLTFSSLFVYGGNGATVSFITGNYLSVQGNNGESGFGINNAVSTVGFAGSGAPSYFGGGALAVIGSSGASLFVNGNDGTSFGSGGGGAVSLGASANGGNGASGIVIITEYA